MTQSTGERVALTALLKACRSKGSKSDLKRLSKCGSQSVGRKARLKEWRSKHCSKRGSKHPAPTKKLDNGATPGLSSTRTVLSCGTLTRGTKGTVDLAHRPVWDRFEVKGPSPHHKEEERGHPKAACFRELKRSQGRMLCNVKVGRGLALIHI